VVPKRQARLTFESLDPKQHLLDGCLSSSEEVNNRMLEFLQSAIFAFRNREDGQALVEYALILALVSVVAIGSLTLLGTNVNAVLSQIANAV
jgi:pilus assembly protein Flp/PilA